MYDIRLRKNRNNLWAATICWTDYKDGEPQSYVMEINPSALLMAVLTRVAKVILKVSDA